MQMQSKLKALLYEKGISQREIAKAIGVAEKTFGGKMRGLRNFTLREAWDICELLNIKNPIDVFQRPE
jgi:transcriptional regulator with XRE-family HTH domain